jgi:hypothetical protein
MKKVTIGVLVFIVVLFAMASPQIKLSDEKDTDTKIPIKWTKQLSEANIRLLVLDKYCQIYVTTNTTAMDLDRLDVFYDLYSDNFTVIEFILETGTYKEEVYEWFDEKFRERDRNR